MELNDARIPFRHGAAEPRLPATAPQAAVHLTVLSEDRGLIEQISRALPAPQQSVDQVTDIAQAETRIQHRQCDVIIVDLETSAAWPETVFRVFDDQAIDLPVILLCQSPQSVLWYRRRARHVVDILPRQAVADPRFSSVISSALLRSEALQRCIELEALAAF